MTWKLSRNLLIVIATLFTGTGIFVGGFVTGARYYDLLPIVIPRSDHVIGLDTIEIKPDAASTPEDLQLAFRPFWESWRLLQENFVDRPLDTTDLVHGAIKGMLRATGDRHTNYMSPDEQEIMRTDMSGELEGIGAEIDTSGDFLRVISPLPGSPAEAAGMLPGDTIIFVDGEDVSGMDAFTVIARVRGPSGSSVTITVLREGVPDPLTMTITRSKITIPSVESRILSSGIAYVKINRFGEHTTDELRTQLQTQLTKDPPGIILDLRNNPGGFLDVGISVTSQFVGNGIVMVERFGDGREREYRALRGGIATKIPLAVLINRGSASAAEIVAGAVKDYQRGTLVGERSYGKGTVQTWMDLSDQQGAVRITFARWTTPKGNSVDGDGLMPDVNVNRSYEQYKDGIDPQLDAAVETLLN
ncbi:MAG: S41 family peptidase [Anaerolineales bacterium]|nr:S41 family peptidase [Anaerolineales bacterium]